MNIPKDYIPIDRPLEEFYAYLKANDRVFLSARFGDGKSTFVEQFKEQYTNDYTFITLYPINYQVADNKDVFEYIKRDILIQLLGNKDTVLKKEDYAFTAKLYYYLHNNATSIAEDLILSIAGSAKLPLEKLFKHIKEFQKYNKQLKAYQEPELAENFITKNNTFIYEFDAISQLIDIIINRYKQNGKKVVLLIEDLDRIDPKHLFRILNVF
jgi:hypothetical protein